MSEFKGEQKSDITTENESVKSEEEFRAEQAQKVIKFLKRIHAYDHAKEIVSGKEERPNFKEFQDFLIRLNGIAREIPISTRSPDGENVQLSGFVGDALVPKHSDKEELLEYAYDAIPDIAKEDVQYMLPAVINAVHLFADGNGRTSRILHQLLTGYPYEKEFLNEVGKALQKDGRYETLDISPGLIGVHLEHIVDRNHGWLFNELGDLEKLGSLENFGGFASAQLREVSEDAPERIKKFFRLRDGNNIYGIIAIHMLLGDEGVKKLFTDKYKGGNPRDLISPLKMIEILKKEDWDKLIDNFYKLKKEEVKNIVDIFKNPEAHRINDRLKTVRDVFIELIQKRGNFI